MAFNQALYSSFLAELQKVAASRHRLSVSKARSGRRSLSVQTLLKKDKEGTLFKKHAAEGSEPEHKLQGHTTHQGLEIAIENAKGSVRKGVDRDGKKWRTIFNHPYGYLKNTEGKDGEEIDVYLGPNKVAPHAFVVHQRLLSGRGHDEDKVMLGFDSKAHAREAYLDHYNKVGPKLLGPISTIGIEELKRRLEEKRKHTKLAMASPFIDLDEKPTPTKPGDAPSRDGTNPGAVEAKTEDGRGAAATIPTNGAQASSGTGATTRL